MHELHACDGTQACVQHYSSGKYTRGFSLLNYGLRSLRVGILFTPIESYEKANPWFYRVIPEISFNLVIAETRTWSQKAAAGRGAS